MISVARIDRDPVPAAVLPHFEGVLHEAGGAGFYEALSRTVRQALPIDRLYLFGGDARTGPLIAEAEAGKPIVSSETYVARFLPADPLQAAICDAGIEDEVLRLCVTPSDITEPTYRAMLERAAVTERLSFVRRTPQTWWCMTVARRRPAGSFVDRELDWLGGYFRLIMPLIARQPGGATPMNSGADRIAELEARFGRSYPQLTRRERQVCARAVIGVSIEGAALDLGIGTASILTYRQRAYRRLAVRSAFELARLVMR